MEPTTIIQIYLPVRGSQVSFLSIPRSDIQRLSVRPLKWIRFVMFSICGAHGDIAATPDGPPANYESTALDEDQYYFRPSEEYIFVDPHGLNDRFTSSELTSRRVSFRREIIQRDGPSCIITGEPPDDCDAAHLIPRQKGDEYIKRVIQDRFMRYDSVSSPISGIDDIQNGMFLSSSLHRKFARGAVGFLKTPNFAIDSVDIPRIARGSVHGNHITLHQLNPNRFDPARAQEILDQVARGQPPYPIVACDSGLNVDALFPNPGSPKPLPPAIILDFLYGVAAYKQWKSGSIHDVVKDYFTEHYESIPAAPHCQPHDFDDDQGDCTDDSGDNYQPSRPTSERGYSREDVLASAIDEMNMVMMYLKGTTPQEVARKREKQMEEEEMIAQGLGRSKVTEWMKTVDCFQV